jgi:hypothetical protein
MDSSVRVSLVSCLFAAQGRLPEIDVLQKQISKAHEEISDLRFKLEEQRAAAAAKEQTLTSDKRQLESQLEAATHQKDRLQLEATAATTRATQHEKQLEELYELCTTQQGECAAVFLFSWQRPALVPAACRHVGSRNSYVRGMLGLLLVLC